jgi:hypothetical protein
MSNLNTATVLEPRLPFLPFLSIVGEEKGLRMRLLFLLIAAALFAVPHLGPTFAFYTSKEYRTGVNLSRAKDACLGGAVAKHDLYNGGSLSELCACAIAVHASNKLFEGFLFDFTALSKIEGFDKGLGLCALGFNRTRL